MQCPNCGSIHIRKHGIKQGKQNHISADCGRQFIDAYDPPRTYSNDIKQECLKMYVNGMGFYGIERVKSVISVVTDGWKVYPGFIDVGDHILSKTVL